MRLAARVRAVPALSALALLLAPAPTGATEGRPPPGATSCTGCHATGAAMQPISGRPAPEIAAALAEYRSGARPATVMNRIAKGFTEAESQAIAAYFAQGGPER
ncbi:c-type cytochrome [Methylobacterium planeticum]|uniref:Cytochrome C n=1 Tax=Methylobacterium planeticum TaxID=2615211 RepID=A0A6N6MSX9_9HYPH|nr:cytochrome C [Methylobacterium planeticum]KAB1074391.1 cytochrome C [Methylobacterium planeticum]